jgi:STE24 endopeptidase
MIASSKNGFSGKAKQYSAIKYSLAICETVYTLILLLLFQASGFSRVLSAACFKISTNHYVVLPIYIFIVSVAYYFLIFPLNFYRSFILEHKFLLTRQRLGDWFLDQVKSGVISYIIITILMGFFYFVLKHSRHNWWIIISIFWISFSIILAKLTPVIIIPLFFKYKPLTDSALKNRIFALADRLAVKIIDVYEIDFSKKTLKGNAGFVGIGRTRRVILADTLKDKYTEEEIEIILAHEFAHYRLRHLLKIILSGTIGTILLFYVIFRTSDYFLQVFSLTSLSDIAALPILFIYFIILGIIIQPLQNYISRRMERNADLLALRVTGLKDAFISTMEKLSSQNLADRNPHPLIKFFFFDHPPIDARIALARQIETGSSNLKFCKEL